MVYCTIYSQIGTIGTDDKYNNCVCVCQLLSSRSVVDEFERKTVGRWYTREKHEGVPAPLFRVAVSRKCRSWRAAALRLPRAGNGRSRCDEHRETIRRSTQ